MNIQLLFFILNSKKSILNARLKRINDLCKFSLLSLTVAAGDFSSEGATCLDASDLLEAHIESPIDWPDRLGLLRSNAL